MIDIKDYSPSMFWMRSVSFIGMLNFLRSIENTPDGLTPKETVKLIEDCKPFFVRDNQIPSKTTIYHYRNTLLHLGALERRGEKLYLGSSIVISKLLRKSSLSKELGIDEKTQFGELVFKQKDCRSIFLDIFWPNKEKDYTLHSWISKAVPVIWKEIGNHDKRVIQLKSEITDEIILLETENQIQAILYGIRYWLRDELGLIDELYREGFGNIMFPITLKNIYSEKEIMNKIIDQFIFKEEWERKNIKDIVYTLCINLHLPVSSVFKAIKTLKNTYPGYVVFIPTSRSFATITAISNQREELELKSYLKDDKGSYISHIRIHKDLKEMLK